MAIETTADNVNVDLSMTQSTSLTDIVRAILAPLASLKLTVFLLAMSVFVVWIVTLEQVSIDIWEMKNKHFHNIFVLVPANTFFPPKWFPNVPRMSWGIYVPSGFTLIIAMLINLTTAHLLRFRIQASGIRLVVGIAVLIAASLLTWAIIINHADANGIGGQPPIPWDRMWNFLQVAVFGLGIASVYGALTVGSGQTIERIAYSLFAFVLLGMLVGSLILGDQAFIGDPAMRILWQLGQSTLAALAVLGGCTLLFKRKAGIVLLHLGIAGILLNEIFVTVTNEEHVVSIAEGETVHHAIDLRETELVIIDRSDPKFDKMSVVPGNILASSVDQIDNNDIPFKIRCLDYFQNSDVIRVGPHADNKADAGFGRSFVAVSTTPVAGADANSGGNQSSAYIELTDREDNERIGVFLVSQAAFDQGIIDTVALGDQEYQIGLRFKTVYPPYSLRLKDATAEHYVGTEIPKWYSSDFVITDEENGITTDQKIWMNNPLRYRDQTFYQLSYGRNAEGIEKSGIQIVRNRSWMIPYVCCMFVVVGLVSQFQQTLSSHLANVSRRKTKLETAGDVRRRDNSWAAWAPTVLLMGFFALYVGSKLTRSVSPRITKAPGSEIRLDLLGRVPVTYGGRVQPLDSYARNMARQLSNREFVTDGFGKKQPAIRWLADMMFGASSADGYEILRIEDLFVQNALGLQRRKGLKFTFSEIREANSKLIELLLEAEKLPRNQWTPVQLRLEEVYGKSRMLMGSQTAFFGTDGRFGKDSPLDRLELAASLANSKSLMPFAIPTKNDEEPWMPLSIAVERNWLSGLADDLDNRSIRELAVSLLEEEAKKLRPELVKEKIIADLMGYEEIVEVLAKRFSLDDPQQLAEALSRNWDQIPKRLYADEAMGVEKFVDAHLRQWRVEKEQITSEMIQDVCGGSLDEMIPVDLQLVDNLSGLKKAYLDGDAKTFNDSLEQHISMVGTASPVDWNQTSHDAELIYNYFSPFYVAMFLYLIGFLVTALSWMGMRKPLNRAAFFIVCLAFLIQFGGIAARVVISGRPPITNLYSSFVVVAAVAVLILLAIEFFTRMGLGNLLAGLCGFEALLYAWTMSIDQGDTFTMLRAVLDTQFWLTTHVLIINMGYSATLVAGLTSVVFLFRLIFDKQFSKQERKTFTNIVYGNVCFALLFSFFGTVLGGLWGDDSWGRFWGWDPKENGALMIVLWNAVVLHARWAGLVRERGLAALAVFGNVIVMWSWEGVNRLGVGLHAYGGVSAGNSSSTVFQEPVFYLIMFVVLHLVIAGLACIVPRSFYRSLNAD